MTRDTEKRARKQAGELDPIDFMEQGPGDSIPSNPSGIALMIAGIAIGAGFLYLVGSQRERIADYARNLIPSRGRGGKTSATEVVHH